jgi:hypothetical protein
MIQGRRQRSPYQRNSANRAMRLRSLSDVLNISLLGLPPALKSSWCPWNCMTPLWQVLGFGSQRSRAIKLTPARRRKPLGHSKRGLAGYPVARTPAGAEQWRPATCKLTDEDESCSLDVYVDETVLYQIIYIHTSMLNHFDIRHADSSLFLRKELYGAYVCWRTAVGLFS